METVPQRMDLDKMTFPPLSSMSPTLRNRSRFPHAILYRASPSPDGPRPMTPPPHPDGFYPQGSACSPTKLSVGPKTRVSVGLSMAFRSWLGPGELPPASGDDIRPNTSGRVSSAVIEKSFRGVLISRRVSPASSAALGFSRFPRPSS